MQRYNTGIAVLECLDNFFNFFFVDKGGGHFGHLVIWSKSFSACQNLHYNNKYIYYYSEQMTNPKMKMTILTLTNFDHFRGAGLSFLKSFGF